MNGTKFKVWNEIEKKMFKPFDLNEMIKGHLDYDEDEMRNSMGFPVGTIFLQFVGVNDKNKKEICNGDIIKYKDESNTPQIGIVKDCGYLKFYIEAIGGDDEGNQDLEIHPDYEFEIIGNKFENPKLLEEKLK